MLSVPRLASHCRTRAWGAYQRVAKRSLCNGRDSNTIGGEDTARPKASQTSSLLDELFPGDLISSDKQPERRRHIPRLPLHSDIGEHVHQKVPTQSRTSKRKDPYKRGLGPIRLIKHYVDASREHKKRAQETAQAWSKKCHPEPAAQSINGQSIALLVLYNASPSLLESDFRRIVPRGKHIEEWKQEGEILKIIPGRDPETLAPLGFYFLLFSSQSSAIAYQTEVARLHLLAAKYTPRNLDSPIPPPPGYIVAGEDIHAALQSFTLIPATQRLVLKLIKPPFSSSVEQIIAQGGYARLAMRNIESPHAVSFHIDGFSPPQSAIETVIEQDGNTNRLLPWGLVRQGAICELDGLIKPDRKTAAEEEDEEEEGYEDEDEGEQDEEEQVHLVANQRKGNGNKQEVKASRGSASWIITFEDGDEAKRFVRAWHKRPFPFSKKSPMYGQPEPIVDAEILW